MVLLSYLSPTFGKNIKDIVIKKKVARHMANILMSFICATTNYYISTRVKMLSIVLITAILWYVLEYQKKV